MGVGAGHFQKLADGHIVDWQIGGHVNFLISPKAITVKKAAPRRARAAFSGFLSIRPKNN
jgi:hypothetical protein